MYILLEVKCEHCGAHQQIRIIDFAGDASGGTLCFYCGDIFGWEFTRDKYEKLTKIVEK